jgi:VanZ family protein
MRSWHWWLALAVGLALIWWESSHPGDELPGVQWWGRHDKIVHASAWAVLAVLAAGGALARGWRARTAIGFAVVLGVGYGLVDEWHQSHVPHRDASLDDVCADLVGSVLGAAAIAWVYRRRDVDPSKLPRNAPDAGA